MNYAMQESDTDKPMDVYQSKDTEMSTDPLRVDLETEHKEDYPSDKGYKSLEGYDSCLGNGHEGSSVSVKVLRDIAEPIDIKEDVDIRDQMQVADEASKDDEKVKNYF